ncbi:MAG TPA: DNA polymerase III subunit beta [Thermoguttaceae bacterium]|nr:DNA polymerase III subunit beta [Thermoguttaceae bacterium]
MQIQCDREKLLRAFQTAAAVVPTRSPKPILQNIKLETINDGVCLMATDLEVGVRIDVGGFHVAAPGRVLLPVDRVGSILRETSDETLTLQSDGRRVIIEGQQSRFQLPAEDPVAYPDVQDFDAVAYHEVPARAFRELVRRTVFATDNESTRYALGGVLVELGDTEITGVGTDGRRLAKQVGPATAVGGVGRGEEMTIVPARAMHLLERALADNDEQIFVAVRDNAIVVRSQRTTIYARLIEGRFPNWKGVFPRNDDAAQITLAAGSVHGAVRQAAIVTSEERRGVDFRFTEGKLELVGHGGELGESRVELPIAYDGHEISIRLDPRYVGDFLKVLDADQNVVLEVKDADTAAVFRTEDGYAYVIMPLSQGQ